MGKNGNLHQRIARFAFTARWNALAAQTQDLPLLNSRWNGYIQSSAIGQCQPPGCARDRIKKFDG